MFFFFNDTATTEIYTLSLHDALPIYPARSQEADRRREEARGGRRSTKSAPVDPGSRSASGTMRGRLTRSEEHTSELQSQSNLVCRLLLEKQKAGRSRACHATTTWHDR